MVGASLKYLRFVTPNLNEESGYPSGLFVAAWAVRHANDTLETDREMLRSLLVWFGSNMSQPDRFHRSNSKGAGRRNWRGLSWFKDGSTKHIAKMYEMGNILYDYGYPITVLSTNRPGFIVYEDNIQVVAEPFADTPTR